MKRHFETAVIVALLASTLPVARAEAPAKSTPEPAPPPELQSATVPENEYLDFLLAQESEPTPEHTNSTAPEPPPESASSGPKTDSTASESGVVSPEPQPYEQIIPVETAPVATAASAQKPTGRHIEEIVITANKRPQSERTLAGAVSAVTRERLDEAGASSFSEYLSLSPGVNFNSGTPGYSVITIRGVSSDTIPSLTQTAVGTYYDDIPLTDPGATIAVPDIDAFDADRIEVLRGPQGALYGSSSLGGAVNYIPQSPDPDNFGFSAQAFGDLKENSSLGGGGRMMANLPLPVEGAALRVVGYYTHVPGYIDNIGLDREQSNASTTAGGRAIMGFEPTPDSRLHFTALTQRTTADDAGYVDKTLGDLKKDTTQLEPSENQIKLGGLRYELDTNYGDWTFVGAYQDKVSQLSFDGKAALGLQATGQLAPLILTQGGSVKGYSGELRYVSPAWERFDFLAGASYANRDEYFEVILDSEDLAQTAELLRETLAQVGISLPSTVDAATTVFRTYAWIQAPETAFFIDGNLHVTDTIKLAAGGRYYHNVVDSNILARGLLLAPTGSTEYRVDNVQSASGFNPKVSLSWEATPDLMLYALYSRGYRLGGPNLAPSTALTPTPLFYGSDEVRNYELGIRTTWLDGALTADLTGFWIDWEDIPLLLTNSLQLFKYIDNVGDARSRGVEASLAMRPLSFLTARSSATWLDARLLNDFDPNNGLPPAKAGDRLPGAPEWTVTNSLIAAWDWGNHSPSVALIHRYESASSTNLSFPGIKKGNFHTLDVRGTAHFGSFSIAAYGKNLTDVRGTNASNNYKQPSGETTVLRYITPPRSYGLELSYAFE
jgi:iron complex outermembrane receptor protein